MMKKNVLALMAAALLCAGLTACGGGGSSTIGDYCDALEKGREQMFNGKMTNGEFKNKMSEQFMGQVLATEVDKDAALEIVEPFKVVSVSPLYGGIEFEAVINSPRIQDFSFVACKGSRPVKKLRYDWNWTSGESYNVKIFLNVGNIVQGGEKADEELRSIDRVAIVENGSDLLQGLE